MTREEEIRNSAFEYIKSDAVKAGEEYTSFGDFINGAKWADQHPHWISIDDEFPKNYEPVLAAVGGNHFAFVGICLNHTTWYCDIPNKAVEIKGITHWMPLPQAPKEGGAQ